MGRFTSLSRFLVVQQPREKAENRSGTTSCFVGSENQLNTRGILWFYRNIYVPYLRPRGFAWRSPAEFAKTLILEMPLVHCARATWMISEPLYNDSKLVIVPIFEGTGTGDQAAWSAAAGRAVVSTPVGCRGIDPSSGAFVCVDMKRQPREAAVSFSICWPTTRSVKQCRTVPSS